MTIWCPLFFYYCIIHLPAWHLHIYVNQCNANRSLNTTRLHTYFIPLAKTSFFYKDKYMYNTFKLFDADTLYLKSSCALEAYF